MGSAILFNRSFRNSRVTFSRKGKVGKETGDKKKYSHAKHVHYIEHVCQCHTFRDIGNGKAEAIQTWPERYAAV